MTCSFGIQMILTLQFYFIFILSLVAGIYNNSIENIQHSSRKFNGSQLMWDAIESMIEIKCILINLLLELQIIVENKKRSTSKEN